MSTINALQIEMWTLDRVRPYENNPRNNDKAVDAVAASIKEFGFSHQSLSTATASSSSAIRD